MANFNENIYERLQPHERTLRTAYYANYVMSVPSSVGKELTEIYNEIHETDRKWNNCSKCLLDLAKRLGEHYFKYQTDLGMHPETVDTVVKVFRHTKPAEEQQQPAEEPKQEPVEEPKKPQPQKPKNKSKNKKSNGKKG